MTIDRLKEIKWEQFHGYYKLYTAPHKMTSLPQPSKGRKSGLFPILLFLKEFKKFFKLLNPCSFSYVPKFSDLRARWKSKIASEKRKRLRTNYRNRWELSKSLFKLPFIGPNRRKLLWKKWPLSSVTRVTKKSKS